MNTPAPLQIDRATKAFGDTVAVDDISLLLQPEEILSLVGPSGCGKSTLLRMVGGLDGLDSGTIHLAGQIVDDGSTRLPPERRSVGLVFQEHALFPHLKVAANVSFGLRDRTRNEVAQRVGEMLHVVSLDEYGDRYPHELSGGERQRVALARALAPSPALMLFDEPFASLDRNLRDDLRHQVVAALRATGTAALIVTHDQHEALSMGDRIAVMRAGQLVQTGPPSAVFHAPADRFTAAFMGDASFLPISADAGKLRTELGSIDGDVPRGASVAMVRPDDVVFTSVDARHGDNPPSGGDIEATAPIDVVATEYRGTHWLVTVRLTDGSEVLASASHLLDLRPGDTGTLRLVPGHRQVPLVN